jgi:hypothetical protein
MIAVLLSVPGVAVVKLCREEIAKQRGAIL